MKKMVNGVQNLPKKKAGENLCKKKDAIAAIPSISRFSDAAIFGRRISEIAEFRCESGVRYEQCGQDMDKKRIYN